MSKQKLVLTGGCFDVLHVGHTTFLNESKKYGDRLVVLLESDNNIKRLKGEDRPINNQEDRAKVLLSLKAVDKVIMLTDKPDYDSLINELKPSVITITEGDKIIEIKQAQAKRIGAEIRVVKKIKNKSTTEIINLIKNGRISNS